MYKDIFQRAWSITKAHPILWLFGLFVLFWGGKGMELELIFTNVDLLRRNAISPFRPEFWDMSQWQPVVDAITNGQQGLLAVSGVVLLVLFLIAFALMMAVQIGLIDAFGVYSKKEDATDKYRVSHAVEAARTAIGPVAVVNIVSRGAILLLMALVAAPLFVDGFAPWGPTYSAGLFLVLMPIMIVISILTKFALNAIILNKEGVGQALRTAWKLFSQNAGTTIELVVFVFLVYVAVTIVAMAASLIIVMPVYLLGVGLSVTYGSTFGVWIFYNLLGILGALIVGGTAAIFSAWHFGTWTLFYEELTKAPRRSIVRRVFQRNG